MDPLGGEPALRPLPIFELTRPTDLERFAIGSDADVGGLSTVQLAIEQGSGPNDAPRGVFRGVLRAELGPTAEKSGILKRGGYAAFRTKVDITRNTFSRHES